MPSTSASGTTKKSRSSESATAIAPSSVTPTRARKIVSIRCRTDSLAWARIIGSETLQTIRASVSVFTGNRAGSRNVLRSVASGGQRNLIGMTIEVHDHTGQQRAAPVILTEIEIRDLEGEIRRDSLERAVLLCFARVVFRSRFQFVNVRRVEDRLR